MKIGELWMLTEIKNTQWNCHSFQNVDVQKNKRNNRILLSIMQAINSTDNFSFICFEYSDPLFGYSFQIHCHPMQKKKTAVCNLKGR